jgi:hypothetical protein
MGHLENVNNEELEEKKKQKLEELFRELRKKEVM